MPPKKRRASRRQTSPPPAAVQDDALVQYAKSVFPIVAIGASAGGLEAFTELLQNLPADPGMAFVFIQHSEPKHASMLAHILSRSTSMQVEEVGAGETPMDVNRVYVAPSQAQVVVERGRLRLVAFESGTALPIDILFRTLAEDQGSRAIAVVLSGAASDGALGIRVVKSEGGITFAQDESAKFDSMPRAAIVTGAVDFVLPPKQIAKELVRIGRSPYVTGTGGASERISETAMAKLFTLLQAEHDVDFTHYKPSTVERRIRRRMALLKVESIDNYLKHLRENAAELAALYNDILIRVTGFFRDPEVFETITREIAPAMMAERNADNPVRVWVPGCATGEEVYSLAICLLEAAAASGYACSIQIFGTDVSDSAIDQARVGAYPESIEAEVSPERLRRFFTRMDGAFRVSKAVRDCCIFARQNLTKDPPFSKLDMVSCRNVMIYLGATLQRKVMSIFHYALRPSGYLLLGSSETIGNFSDLFGVVDRKHKIYQKKPAVSRINVDFEPNTSPQRQETTRMEEEVSSPANVFREADRVLLARYAPAGVVINESMEILQFRGRTSLFLEPAPGTASFNILKMAREGLLSDLRTAIHGARKNDQPVRREGIRVKTNGGYSIVNIEAIPFTSPTKERFEAVLFEEVRALEPEKKARGRKGKKEPPEPNHVSRLKRELEATREYLQSIIEEQEAMNEELRSANEEIQSSNEELQSTNEELETAKEELQSSNEELTTLNEELENRNQELAEAHNDLVNLLAAVDIPLVMLDTALRIRRFNPGAQRALNLIPSDIGRPFTDLRPTLKIENLEKIVASVIDDLEVREMDVQDQNGTWYSLRIRPYKTIENKIEGAVLVLIEIRK